MSASDSRPYDIVIFGATGFTGQFVVEEVARTQDEEGGLKWAVAGRSMAKLQSVLREASKYTGKDLEEIPILIADVSSKNTLDEMCKQAKIILNCVGPYQLYGIPVVEACIANKTHHIDISGEPVFLENVQLMYHNLAKDAGVYILEACGFDSIPSDMGVIFTRDEFKKRYNGDLNHVEGILDIHIGPDGGRINNGTWNSAIMGIGNRQKLKDIRKSLFPEPLPRSNVRLPKRRPIFYHEDVKSWCLPFMGADRSIVMRSQRYNFEELKERVVNFAEYTRIPSVLFLLYMLLLGVIFGIFTSFGFTRKLMMKYPRLFSLGMFSTAGPTRKQMAGTSFNTMFVGYGYDTTIEDPTEKHTDKPVRRIITRVSGPELAYVTTPICMVQAAYVLRKEQNKLPPQGGVYTPGAAFAKTTMIDRLNKHNMKIEFVE